MLCPDAPAPWPPDEIRRWLHHFSTTYEDAKRTTCLNNGKHKLRAARHADVHYRDAAPCLKGFKLKAWCEKGAGHCNTTAASSADVVLLKMLLMPTSFSGFAVSA